MRKERILTFIIALNIAYIFCSVLPYLFPDFVGRTLPLITLGVTLFLSIKDVFGNKSFIYGCLYCIVLYIIASFFHPISGFGYGRGELDTVLIEIAFILPPVALGAYLCKNRHILAYISLLDIIIYSSLIISAIYMLPVLLYDRSVARYIAVSSEENLNSDLIQYKFGYWDYVVCHIVSLFVALFYGLFVTSQTRKRRIFYLMMTSLIVFFIITLTITTTFIYLIIVLLILLLKKFIRLKLFGILIFCIIGILVVEYVEPILDWLMFYYTDTDMYGKFIDFKDILHGGTGYHGNVDARIDYQQDAMNGFYKNIVIGSSYEGGGHSILLNHLGSTGLLGFIPFVLMIFYQFKQWYKIIPASAKFYYLITWLGIIILLYTKNVFGNPGYYFICVIMPYLCMTFDYPKSILPYSKYKKRYKYFFKRKAY